MSEATDYRVENAKAGRAFYMPGKTIEEVAAERAEREAEAARKLRVTLTAAQASEIEVHLDDVPHVMLDVARALELLHGGIETRCIDPEDPGIPAILRALKEMLTTRAEKIEPVFRQVGLAILDTMPKEKAP
jgi:hypothetical protein